VEDRPGGGTDLMRVLYRHPTSGQLFSGRGLDLFEISESCQQIWTAKLSDSGSKAYEVVARGGGGVFASTASPAATSSWRTAPDHERALRALTTMQLPVISGEDTPEQLPGRR